jgi:hypothetical protein
LEISWAVRFDVLFEILRGVKSGVGSGVHAPVSCGIVAGYSYNPGVVTQWMVAVMEGVLVLRRKVFHFVH